MDQSRIANEKNLGFRSCCYRSAMHVLFVQYVFIARLPIWKLTRLFGHIVCTRTRWNYATQHIYYAVRSETINHNLRCSTYRTSQNVLLCFSFRYICIYIFIYLKLRYWCWIMVWSFNIFIQMQSKRICSY